MNVNFYGKNIQKREFLRTTFESITGFKGVPLISISLYEGVVRWI